MTSARKASRTPYKPPRDRRELTLAVLAVVGVLAFTVAMILVLKPDDEADAPTPVPIPTGPVATTLPVDPTATTVPGAVDPAATLPPVTPAPGG